MAFVEICPHIYGSGYYNMMMIKFSFFPNTIQNAALWDDLKVPVYVICVAFKQNMQMLSWRNGWTCSQTQKKSSLRLIHLRKGRWRLHVLECSITVREPLHPLHRASSANSPLRTAGAWLLTQKCWLSGLVPPSLKLHISVLGPL